MSINIEEILARLESVKKRGQNNWLARCPAHEDKSPSLAIKQTQDEVILLHCFAGCSTDSVLSAIGVEPADLFPSKPQGQAFRAAKHFDAYTALRAVAADALLVLVACRMAIKGKLLTESDINRLTIACGHLQDARTFVLREQ
jgi:hypothetical protein